MKNKQILDPFPPLHIQAGKYPLCVFRVEKSPRLRVNNQADNRNDVLQWLHTHFNYEVFFVVSGSLELRTETTHSTYHNSIVIIPPQIHHVSIRDGESYCLLFSFDEDSTLAQHLEQGVCELPITEEIIFYIRQLSDKTMLRTKEAEQSVHYLASLIFHDILNKVKPQTTPKQSKRSQSDPHINLIDEFINVNYNNPITLTDLANRLHLSQRQITRIINREYHCSFTTLLNNRRLANAVSLLTNTEMSIAQIIEITFCNSPNYFYRVFQKKYGTSPLQYRKQFHALHNPTQLLDD